MNKTDSYAVPYIYEQIHQRTASETVRPRLTVRVPGSKSITNRAMLLAILADGPSVLEGALFSDDSRHFLQCISDLGFPTQANEEACTIEVTGFGGNIPKDSADIYVGSAGTAARFLTALLGTNTGHYHLDASAQMRKRPMAPLLASLESLGARITYDEKEGFFPFTITGQGFRKQSLTVDINQSSQFLSALLIAAACSDEDITIQTTGTHGMAYIDITLHMMEQFGVHTASPCIGFPAAFLMTDSVSHPVENPASDPVDASRIFCIPGGQHYRAQTYAIEPDVSAACYFYAMAPLLGIDVIVKDVHPSSIQGDRQFLDFCVQMGCRLTDTPDGILLEGPENGIYPGLTVDMSACSDQAITMAALAPFAQSPTTITGIGHIRYQESDRIAAMAAELTRMGIRCEERTDSITIWPGEPQPANIHTYDDHRMAMGFALAGLRAKGIVIENPDCCRKTFEGYFKVLDEVLKGLQGGI